MNKAKRIIACILVLALTAVTLSGCTTFDNFRKAFLNKNPHNDAQIIIGIYEPMSGEDKEAGEAEIKGIELAHKMMPELNGAKIELVYADNKSDLETAESAMTELMKKNPTAVLGSYGNAYSLIAGTYLDEAQVPGIAITNTNPLVTKNSPYYFRVSLVDSYQATAMARYVLEELDQKKAGILLPADNEQALAMASSFENYMTDEVDSKAISVYQEYEAGSGDYTAQLQAIKIAGVKSVYLLGDLEDAAGILEQAYRMNMEDVLFMGDSTWADDEFTKKISGYVDGNIAFTTLFSDEELVTDMSEKFVKEYKAEYDREEPEAAAALGFDAYMILLAALEQAGTECTGAELRDALLQIENFHGASGIITFDNTGNPEKSVVINTLKNNKVEALCTIAPDKSSKTDGTGSKDYKAQQ